MEPIKKIPAGGMTSESVATAKLAEYIEMNYHQRVHIKRLDEENGILLAKLQRIREITED